MMKTKLPLHWMTFLSIMLLTTITCSLLVPIPAQPPVQYQTVVITETSQSVIPTVTSRPVVTIVTVIAPTDPGPSCTVLQDLNFRFGPGTAYEPPLYELSLNHMVIPVGYNPVGIPGGSWALVRDQSTNQQGWVSAGAQYISCNIDVTTLPSVAVPPPPVANLPNSALSSIPDGDGFCVDPDSGLKCIVTFSDKALIQFQLLRNGRELNQDNGVEQVSFRVETIDGDFVYENVERTGAYCIFGGNGPCTGWTVKNGVYRWTQGGERVREGEYHVEIEIFYRGDSSLWEADFIIFLP